MSQSGRGLLADRVRVTIWMAPLLLLSIAAVPEREPDAAPDIPLLTEGLDGAGRSEPTGPRTTITPLSPATPAPVTGPPSVPRPPLQHAPTSDGQPPPGAPASPGPAAAISLLKNGPTSIRLAAAGIDSGTITDATVDERGSLEVGASAIGWYRNEAGLGRPGTALLAAHVAYDGRNGPFRWLEDVRTGDALDVVLADGTTHAYTVESVTVHPKRDVPFDQLTAVSGPDRVALVTCTGGFDARSRSFDSNLVVVAARSDAGRPVPSDPDRQL